MYPIESMLESQYSKDNYLVVDNNSNNNFCYIYFSSNALYVKGNEEDFTNRIIKKDRYEWRTLRAKIRPKREIFIRDIWLSWYVRGINEQISDYQKLISFLKEKTNGYVVRCVGASSGGFIANIVAMQLQADVSYCFAGQFSMKNHFDHLEKNPYLREHVELNGEYWVEYYKHLEQSKTKIIYFFPVDSPQDQIQYEQISQCKNIVTLKVKQQAHGICLFPSAISAALSWDYDDYAGLSDEVYSKKSISIKIGGRISYIKYSFRKFIIKLLKRH